MSVFKAYDIRGVYGRDFGPDEVYRIGYFLPRLLGADRVLVGRDVRLSSPEVYASLTAGITASGADVHSLGLTTTPMVYFATARLGFPASVQITASHNPKEYNGLKISRANALPVGYETGLAELERMIQGEVKPAAKVGKVQEIDFRWEYLSFFRSYLPDLAGLRIGVDCSNGMVVTLIKDLLGSAPHYLYDTLDGTFPNHEPNPLEEENVRDLQELVQRENLDLGIIFDGDADRVMFVDERGRFVRPDLITGVLAQYYLVREKGIVLHDIRTSRSVSAFIRELGGTPYMWKVGHAYAKLKMRELGAIFGGELAGHYYFRDFYNCDSGLLACLLVLKVAGELRQSGRSFGEFIDKLAVYPSTGELNFRVERKIEAMTLLRDRFTKLETPEALFDFDGYRVEFSNWWFNVRLSNTEPYLRLIIEADDVDLLAKRRAQAEEWLRPFLSNLAK